MRSIVYAGSKIKKAHRCSVTKAESDDLYAVEDDVALLGRVLEMTKKV